MTTEGFVSLLIGILFSVYLWRRSLPQMSCIQESELLISGSLSSFPSELEVRFAGDSVRQVMRCYFFVWNSGGTTFRLTDLVQGDPLRIEVPRGARVLRARVHRRSRRVANIRCRVEGGVRVVLDFDHLNPLDGACIELFHTGGDGGIELRGSVVGLSGLRTLAEPSRSLFSRARRFFSTQRYPRAALFWRFTFGSFLLAASVSGEPIAPALGSAFALFETVYLLRVSSLVIGVAFVSEALAAWLGDWRGYPARLSPKRPPDDEDLSFDPRLDSASGD